MRTSRRGEEADHAAVDLGVVVDDSPSDLERRADARRRAGTLAAFGVVAVVVAILVMAGSGDGEMDRRPANTTDADAPDRSSLQPGTYRLPGLSAPVSITVPAGWSAGDSIWGPAGEGLAAISTGRPGATISIALLDVAQPAPVRGLEGQSRSAGRAPRRGSDGPSRTSRPACNRVCAIASSVTASTGGRRRSSRGC